jgi:hypothetical protein
LRFQAQFGLPSVTVFVENSGHYLTRETASSMCDDGVHRGGWIVPAMPPAQASTVRFAWPYNRRYRHNARA